MGSEQYHNMLIPEWSWEFENYLIVVGALCLVIQLFYIFFFHARLAFYKTCAQNQPMKRYPVSVIVCAKNESENLSKNLIYLLNQKYHEFEVIVVNDRSRDDSDEILNAFAKTHNNFRWINIDFASKVSSGKKFALTIGIKGAKYDRVLLTDADCIPVSENWIEEMSKGFSEQPNIVIGYSPYDRAPGFLNRLIRYDSTFNGMQYLSFAKSGVPYMGVGRNMGYHKDLFFGVNGFKSHYSLSSGDDDLFVQEAAKRENTTAIITPDSMIKTQPKTSWKAWLNQKSRHLTTAVKYKVFHKLLLGIYPLSYIMLLICFALLLFSKDWWIISSAAFAFVCIVKWTVWAYCFIRLQARELVWWLPFMEIVHSVVLPLIFLSMNETHKKEWL